MYNTLFTQYQHQNKISNGFNIDNFKPGELYVSAFAWLI